MSAISSLDKLVTSSPFPVLVGTKSEGRQELLIVVNNMIFICGESFDCVIRVNFWKPEISALVHAFD
jgi:hypothetical protein